VREKPCVCEHCMVEDYNECETGGWIVRSMSAKGVRNPNEKHLIQQLSEDVFTIPEGEWEILSIQQQRVKHGKIQYLVEWNGYDTMTWVDADELNADELLEDWEIQNSYDVSEGHVTAV
jgi:hypothetical protein